MNPYNNGTLNTNHTSNSTSNSTSGKEGKKDLSLVELELDKDEAKNKDKEFGDDHDKNKRNITNSTSASDNFDETFENMDFTVNRTLAKGWPLRKDDGFPYQEQNG
jgi:hypothetical protein